jgi:hypothetical protein
MGTLFNQKIRQKHYVLPITTQDEIDTIDYLSDVTGYEIEHIIEIRKICEAKRTNDLFIEDGNAKDEQLAGFGELFKELNDQIRLLNETLKNIYDNTH